MSRQRIVTLGMAAALLLGGIAAAAGPLSRANGLLFASSHFDTLQGPAVLRYTLVRTGDQPFSDSVSIDVSAAQEDGSRRVEFQYLSGERERYVPPVPKASGNPVIKVFLQRQVLELERRTGGDWRYHQKAIKRAFAHAATVEDVRFDYRGESVSGTRIEVIPYRNDAYRDRFGEYAATRYVFLLSESVPGEVYRMQASVPDTAGGETPASETLTLTGVN